MNKNNISYWKNLSPSKTTIRLNDLQALSESMNEGTGVNAIDYFIKSRKEIKLCDPTFNKAIDVSYLITELEDKDNQIVYLISLFSWYDKEIAAHFVYYIPNEFPPLFKKDLLERGILWMFDDPGIPDFKPSDLNYAIYAGNPPFVENGEEISVIYKMIDNCIDFGYEQKSANKIPIIIVEYKQDTSDGEKEYKNPYLLILEENYLDENGIPKEQGGYVTILFGCEIQESEIEILT